MDKVNEEEDEELATEKEVLSPPLHKENKQWLEIEKMEEEVNKLGDGFDEPEMEGLKPNFTLGDVKEVTEGEKSHISDAEYLMESEGGVQSSQRVSDDGKLTGILLRKQNEEPELADVSLQSSSKIDPA